jgi:hypothetical protein
MYEYFTTNGFHPISLRDLVYEMKFGDGWGIGYEIDDKNLEGTEIQGGGGGNGLGRGHENGYGDLEFELMMNNGDGLIGWYGDGCSFSYRYT